MTFSIKLIANCFLQRDFEDNRASITPMKLQKLVYCLHGWHLAITGRPAVDGTFQAWPYGPVEEDLYHMFKNYSNQPIDAYAQSWDNGVQKAFVVNDQNKEFYDILNFVSNKYMRFSAIQLSALTHQDGTPWSITRSNGKTYIDNSLIAQHFRELAA